MVSGLTGWVVNAQAADELVDVECRQLVAVVGLGIRRASTVRSRPCAGFRASATDPMKLTITIEEAQKMLGPMR